MVVDDIELVGDLALGDIGSVGDVVVGDIELVGDVVVGYIMYSISQAIMKMRKDCIQTVLKDRTYHAQQDVETSFG